MPVVLCGSSAYLCILAGLLICGRLPVKFNGDMIWRALSPYTAGHSRGDLSLFKFDRPDGTVEAAVFISRSGGAMLKNMLESGMGIWMQDKDSCRVIEIKMRGQRLLIAAEGLLEVYPGCRAVRNIAGGYIKRIYPDLVNAVNLDSHRLLLDN